LTIFKATSVGLLDSDLQSGDRDECHWSRWCRSSL